MLNDTIAAIATPLGSGGISVIRISGDNAFGCAEKIFKAKDKNNLTQRSSHSIVYGHIIDDEIIIDEVLLSIMKAPRTYTREDVVEISCHGGYVSARRVLEAALKSGARLAEPGEFTKRAFLNGRIDLTQAEAVIDIINSETSAGQKAAENQLEGVLSKKIALLRDSLLDMIASLEASIDYPEYDLVLDEMPEIDSGLCRALEKINSLLETAESGRILREGIKCVILGRPNVGKSSLLNALSGHERAIVTNIAGTTRDVLTEFISLGGIPLKLYDTAGIRASNDEVEQIGVLRAQKEARDAQLIIIMLDGSSHLTKEDIELIKSARDKKHLILINKSDLKTVVDFDAVSRYTEKENIFVLSVKNNNGLSSITKRIKELFMLGQISSKSPEALINERHKQELLGAKKALMGAREAIEGGLAEDFICIHIRDALIKLANVSGEGVDDEIIDRVFTRFCLGK